MLINLHFDDTGFTAKTMNKMVSTAKQIIALASIGVLIAGCQSSSQSSSSSPPSMPSASSSSASSSPSMPSSSPSSSSSSPSMPSSSSSSSSASSSSASSSQSGSDSSSFPASSSSQSQSQSQSQGSAGESGQQSASQSSAAGQQRAGSIPSPSGDGSQGQQQASAAGQQQGQGTTAAGSTQSNTGASTSPSQGAGTEARLPGNEDGSGQGRQGAAGDLGNGSAGSQSGAGGSNSSILAAPSGDYSLDTLPNGALGGTGSSQGDGAMTNAERIQVLDERLRKGYETFDGFILSERERAQNESNAAGSVAIGGDGAAGGAEAANQPQTMPSENGASASGPLVASQPSASARNSEETFAPPDDIPSGRDDDVVARQIRELAMNEPDPELREAIWDEYRKYTGISTGDEQ